jgi:DNA repair protein RadC
MNSNTVKHYRIPQLAVRLVKEQNLVTSVPKIVRQPEDAYKILRPVFEELTVEHFVAMLLNTKNHVLGISTISCGSLNASIVHPRELFRVALLHGGTTASLILAHNHPSTDPTPSPEDIALTSKLVDAGKLLEIPILDHIICCENRFISFKEKGLI